MDKWNCFQCGNQLTEKEEKFWQNNSPRCCNGIDCGCQGMPIDPPECFECSCKSLVPHALKQKEQLDQLTTELEQVKGERDSLLDTMEQMSVDKKQLREALERVLANDAFTIEWAHHVCKQALTAGKGE